jgi:hypothetical protein
MKKIAILLAGEFFCIALRKNLQLKGRPSAEQVYAHALHLAERQTSTRLGAVTELHRQFVPRRAQTARC